MNAKITTAARAVAAGGPVELELAAADPIMSTYGERRLSFVRGEGRRLFDEAGRGWLDFAAGIATSTLGHGDPALVAALQEAATRPWHVSNLYRVPGQERVARMLVRHTFADRVFFANSGTEAIEGAIKCARRFHHAAGAPHRHAIVTLAGCFHGRTLGALSAGANPRHLDGCGPAAPGFVQVPADDAGAIAAALGDEVAAVLLEPVQGEGGLRPLEADYLREVRALTREAGVLLVLDEVQCGAGRTGTLLAHEDAGIEPDVVAMAKGLGGGFPVGAILATERAASGMTAGAHGSTFGGNPLAMAAVEAVLGRLLEPGFFASVVERGAHLRARLEALVAAHPRTLAAVRGRGLMLGLVLADGAPCTAAALRLALEDGGLLSVPAAGEVLRLLPPLTVTEDELDEAHAILERVVTALED